MDKLLAQDQNYLLNVYKRMDLHVESTHGSYLVDSSGNRYLDMVGGIAVNGLGYSNPQIRDAIVGQLDQYIHLSNYFASPAVVGLAKLLVDNSMAAKVFFSNSGAEANEAAFKLVRKYGKSVSPDKIEVLSLHNSFHGRTFGGMTLTGQPKYKEPFAPVVPGVRHVALNDIRDLERNVSNNTCAIFLEMIQGESGVRELSPDFVEAVYHYASKHNYLVVADEIQTGLGRTGDLFAYEHYQFSPDIVTLGKAIGGGLPLGAMLVSSRLQDVLVKGDHGSTFGGNPVACAAGQVVLQAVAQPAFLNDIKSKGNYVINELKKISVSYPSIITEIRGRGLMLGIEAGDHAVTIQSKARELGILLNVTNSTVVRLLPPLTISYPELETFVAGFRDSLANL